MVSPEVCCQSILADLYGARLASCATAWRSIAGAKPIKGHVTGTVKETLIAAPATYRLEVSASGPTSLGGVARTSWELPEVTLDLANSILRLKHASWNGSLDVANGDRVLGR